jgi:acyl-CoA thioesterase FadM
MNLWLRLLGVLIGSLFRPRLGLLDESVLPGRVWLTDLDLNIHMNNARYLAVMDLGRMDIFLRARLIGGLIQHRIQPVVGSTMVRYRRALRPFQQFVLRTRCIGWDERRVYLDFQMWAGDKLACHAVCWTAFRKDGKRIEPVEVARLLGVAQASPPLPAWTQSMRDLEGAIGDPAIEPLAKAAE